MGVYCYTGLIPTIFRVFRSGKSEVGNRKSEVGSGKWEVGRNGWN